MINDNFLLNTDMAQWLFHDVAKALPIIDYHCHLDPVTLAENRLFANLTELWISTDPYKHRAMRIAGVPERLITGRETSDRERFNAWAATLPQTLGNPLFHWTALELRRVFDIDEVLSPTTADRIWDACNEKLASPEFSARGLLAMMGTELICTSDSLDADLTAHEVLAASDFGVRVLPSIRDAKTLDATCFDRFAQFGCRIVDHAVGTAEELPALKPLAVEYAKRGWIMQLHLGAQRETSSRLRALAGAAGGYATIGNSFDISTLCRFLDDLERDDALPRTILFPLNPVDYASIATLTGSFSEDNVPGKLQFGPAWWYNDHALGIVQHLENLSHFGLISTFIGMTTDSRSLLSMVRHEYFRRILCDWIGDQVAQASLPTDKTLLADLVRKICYNNARNYLKVGEQNS